MSHVWMFVFFMIFAYLSGSLSTAILLAKVFRLPDPRSAGSGNPGATNMLRMGGKKLAIFVLMGDLLKGFLVVFIATFLLSPLQAGWVGLLAVVGHMYPIFFQFKGGKGVATGAGVVLALSLPLGALVLATWVGVAFLFRYSSLAAIISTIFAPVYAFWLNKEAIIPVMLISVLILYRHYGNMRRLIEGSESKMGKSS
jgi:glycerol-3-phosphate acyltransferase PlsY